MRMWLGDDTLRARSAGEVHKPDSYNYVTHLPIDGGLYCPRIFGPVGWRDGEAIGSDDREGWGHIELPELVARRVGPARCVILVVAPRYRRGTRLTAEAHRERARRRRAELQALATTDQWPYCDPVDKVLAEEGLTDPREIDLFEECWLEPPINVAYRTVVNQARSTRRLSELGAPDEILNDARAALATACAHLDAELTRSELPSTVLQLALGRSAGETS